MYTPLTFKFGTSWRKLFWRLQNPTYGIFIGSTVLSLFGVRALATGYGPQDTYRRRLADGSTFKDRRFGEVDDNPLYRLPENANGGHKLSGLSSQQERRAHLSSH